MKHCPPKQRTATSLIAIILILCNMNHMHLMAQDTLRRVGSARLESGIHITIDGSLNETAWSMAERTTGFVSYDPHFGHEVALNTTAKFCYDDYGLYVALEMFDHRPDSIFRDLSVRDDMGNADWIGLLLSPSNDGQNGFRFQVSAAGVQYDAKIIMDDNDESWDAVWYSKTGVSAQGWVVEMLIPWSAIRFPNQQQQSWDMNLIREVRRHRELSTWNPVDKHKHGFLTQSGKLTGLKDLETPVRLALLPYASGYVQKISQQPAYSYTFNAGLDVKYGIRNNYTLDLTLIPDFGQVRSDDEIYNFSPHEVMYNENRPFFTEGTELFDKAGIFYSRRIGQRPVGYNDVYQMVDSGETVISNPQEAQLINATKFSGRNSKGFAIGLFNAMTAPMYATIQGSDETTRQLLTQPFTNYNMVVLDQSLKHNSYIHLANTNLYRNNFLANVTATTFQFKDKKQRIALYGEGKISHQVRSEEGAGESDPGYNYALSIRRISGKIRWMGSYTEVSKRFNPNDMGYLAKNNYAYFFGEIGYYQFTPIRNMLNFQTVFSSSYNLRQEGYLTTHKQMNLRASTTFRNRLSVGTSFEIVPGMYHDYYEARTPGRVFSQPGYNFFRFWYSPDYRKTFLIDLNTSAWMTRDQIQRGFNISASPRLRLNSRSLVLATFALDRQAPVIGYNSHTIINDSTNILFAERTINTFITSISSSYIVNPLSSFSLRVRHYWVTTENHRYFVLPLSGIPDPVAYQGNDNFTFNIFNIDLTYSWNFAPGSFLNIVYKNAISSNNRGIVQHHYIRNWEEMLDSPVNNSLSVKMIYYFDYETIRTGIKTKRK